MKNIILESKKKIDENTRLYNIKKFSKNIDGLISSINNNPFYLIYMKLMKCVVLETKHPFNYENYRIILPFLLITLNIICIFLRKYL